MKFYNSEYVIDKSEYQKLRDKIQRFTEQTASKATIALTLITTFGVKNNEYAQDIVNDYLKADLLFEPLK
jgi:hypothetical protein